MLQVPPRTLKVLLIWPRFLGHSFWDFRAACEAIGARYPGAPLSLITVAAMLPARWTLRLVDRNVEDLTDADIGWADLVMTGGMMAQQSDTLNIIETCQSQGKRVAVGGPDITSSPHLYTAADFVVIGEAEGVIDDVIAAIERGDTRGVFEAEKFQADVTKTPIPRFDLLTFSHYLNVGVQFSRGCPFTCEFCDIIELYGRVPRAKTDDQMLAELDELSRCGYRGWVNFVDDNMIGNKKALKRFLPKLVAWQKAHGYPFEFSTEASINLADDEELLTLLAKANFFAMFIGIETPDPETLVAISKKQNTRRDLVASIDRIYEAGILVTAGFIIGFDNEKRCVATQISDFVEGAAIPACMVNLLCALPNTQLSRRLAREGRLHPNSELAPDAGDQRAVGLNFDTARPRAEILCDCKAVVQDVYRADVYFKRVRKVGRRLNCSEFKVPYGILNSVRFFGLMFWSLARDKSIAPHFWRTFLDCALHNPRALPAVMKQSALYLHFGPYSRLVIEKLDQDIAEQTSWWQRQTLQLEAHAAFGVASRSD